MLTFNYVIFQYGLVFNCSGEKKRKKMSKHRIVILKKNIFYNIHLGDILRFQKESVKYLDINAMPVQKGFKQNSTKVPLLTNYGCKPNYLMV